MKISKLVVSIYIITFDAVRWGKGERASQEEGRLRQAIVVPHSVCILFYSVEIVKEKIFLPSFPLSLSRLM
jgi:hypothetical protein